MDSIISNIKDLAADRCRLQTMLFTLYNHQQHGSPIPKQIGDSLHLSMENADAKELISFNLPENDKLYYIEKSDLDSKRSPMPIYEMEWNTCTLKLVGGGQLSP